MRETLDPRSSVVFNLLERPVEDLFLADTDAFARKVLVLDPSMTTVVVDEVQKIPRLLDAIHNLIETHKVPQRFVLTGSSARKLRAGAANLLGGRAAVRHLFPLTSFEIGTEFDIQSALSFGTLPQIWTTQDPAEKADLLRAYSSVYLKEEVWAEQLIRKLEPFRRFLEVAAQHSGKVINFSEIAKDAQTNDKSVATWFGLLEDTLLGFYLDAFHTSVRKQIRASPKFYLFDPGVTRALAGHLGIPVNPKTSYYGDLFEAFVIAEVRARCHYLQNDFKLNYLQTKSDVEIDLVLTRPGRPKAFVEIKSTNRVDERFITSLKIFLDDFPKDEFFLLTQDPQPQSFGRIRAVHWQQGIQELLGLQ